MEEDMPELFGKRYFSARPCENGSVALTVNPAGGYEDVGLPYVIATSENVHVNCPNGKQFTVLLVKACAPGVICLAFHVTTNHNRGKGGQTNCWQTMMLGVNANHEGKVVIDLDNPWTPRMGRTGYLDSHQSNGPHEISATANGVTYTNYPIGIFNRPNTKLVPDANLIASYLAGDFVEAEDLDKAATAHTEEVRARERLPELERELGCFRDLDRLHQDMMLHICQNLGAMIRDDFGITPDDNDNIAGLFKRYREAAQKRIVSRDLVLKRLGVAIQTLERDLQLSRWNPWNWGMARLSARQLVRTARENNVIADIPG